MPVKALTHQDIQSLMDDLSRTSDTRKRRGIRHSRISLVATLVCAILSGTCHKRAMAEWAANLSNSLKRRLGFRRPPKTRILIATSGAPFSRSTSSRSIVSSRLVPMNPAQAWPRRRVSVLAHSGQAVRGASKAKGGQKIHTHAAFLQNRGIVGERRAWTRRPTRSPNSAPFSLRWRSTD